MSYGIVLDVPCRTEVAYFTCDWQGRLRCIACDPDLSRDYRGKPRMLTSKHEMPDSNCEICRRLLWDTRVEVQAVGPVEYVDCKIF